MELNAAYAPLVERIVAEATVVNERILKIDHFLNHQIEPGFMAELGHALGKRLRRFNPDLILTAEASGIAPALMTAHALNIPLVYAKKYSPLVEPPELARVIPSPTKGGETMLMVSGRYLHAGARVALVDDFLANGRTAAALCEIVAEAGAQVVAAGFIVEKCFQSGRALLEAQGIAVGALARVERLEAGRVIIAN